MYFQKFSGGDTTDPVKRGGGRRGGKKGVKKKEVSCRTLQIWHIHSLKSEQKSLVKQQILMYKTALYRLVNGGITHQ